MAKKRFKTFEEACAINGDDPKKICPAGIKTKKGLVSPVLNFLKLVYMIETANTMANGGEVWQPDWSNVSEYKYYPWFKMQKNKSGSGFGFANFVSHCARTSTGLGSRLVFKTREWAVYAGKNWKEYREVMLLPG